MPEKIDFRAETDVALYKWMKTGYNEQEDEDAQLTFCECDGIVVPNEKHVVKGRVDRW